MASSIRASHAFCVCIACVSPYALAQQVPDAGTLLRENERQKAQLPKPTLRAIPADPTQLKKSDLRITVKAFKITGNSLIPEAELQAVLAPWLGKEAGYAELQKAVDAVAEAYRKRGWFARPQLPAQDVTEGTVTIHVAEARLGAVQIDDQGKPLRTQKDFILRSMTARQQPGEPLNQDHLDRATAILNETPGIAASTALGAGARSGETNAIVKVMDKSPLSAVALADNQGARSTGENKLTVSGSLDNLYGIGDQIQANANYSDGNAYLKFGYSRPVGFDGLRLGASASVMEYQLLGDLASMKALGNAQTYGVNGTYPWLRGSAANVSLAFSYDHKHYYNEANGSVTSDKTLNAVTLALSGDVLDGLGAGGLTQWSLNATGGQVGLGATPSNALADQNGPRTAGGYAKLAYSLSRLQRLTANATLWASINGQWAANNLDSSEKMSLGGPSGIRAYPVIEGTGDDGWTATVESRHTLRPNLQLSAFYDHGWVKQSHDPAYTGSPPTNTGSFRGAGLGLSWSLPAGVSVKAIWARRIGANPFANPLNGKDQDGTLTKDRFWLTAIKAF